MHKGATKQYHKVSLTSDVVLFCLKNDQLHVLLVQRAIAPYQGIWALPGGFVREGETAIEAGERVLRDKAGTTDLYLEQLFTFDAPKRDPRDRVVSVAHFALVHIDKLRIQESTTTQHPQLFLVSKLPELAFDHHAMIAYALKRLRAKLEYTSVVYALLPKQFTMPEVQTTYEAILGKQLDKRNFQKKFLSLDLVRKTNKKREGVPHRPAVLYEFKSRNFSEFKKSF